MLGRRLHAVAPLLTLAVVGVAAAVIAHVLRQYSLSDILGSLRQIRADKLALACLCALGSYLVQMGFDTLGARYVAGSPLPVRAIAFASFVSFSIGHSTGFGPASAVRYRLYSRLGLGDRQVGMVVMFSAGAVFLGELLVSGAFLALAPDSLARLGLSGTLVCALGVLAVTAVAVYAAVSMYLRRPLRLFGVSVDLPSWPMALGQILLGVINFALVIGVLYQTLSSIVAVTYAGTAALYIVGNLASLLSHVPAGIGVLDSVFLLSIPNPGVVGGLLAFRIVYYLVPLTIGLALLGAFEATGISRRLCRNE